MKDTINDIGYFEEVNDIKKRIMDKLSNLGYNFKHKGTPYIFNAIIYIRQMIRHIANKYNKSINNIKTNIIKSTILTAKDKRIKGS